MEAAVKEEKKVGRGTRKMVVNLSPRKIRSIKVEEAEEEDEEEREEAGQERKIVQDRAKEILKESRIQPIVNVHIIFTDKIV